MFAVVAEPVNLGEWLETAREQQAELSLRWFEDRVKRPAGSVWVPHDYGPGGVETINVRDGLL